MIESVFKIADRYQLGMITKDELIMELIEAGFPVAFAESVANKIS
jgi:hypothetical protein